MIETVSGMSLAITKLLYEKGLEIPANNQRNISASVSRTRSRMSILSSGRASECSLITINGREDDILSRRSYHFGSEFLAILPLNYILNFVYL